MQINSHETHIRFELPALHEVSQIGASFWSFWAGGAVNTQKTEKQLSYLLAIVLIGELLEKFCSTLISFFSSF